MKQTILSALTLLALCGCSTNQTTAAFKAETGTKMTVAGAMTGWGVYVGAYHPGTNAEQQVYAVWKSTQAAELLLVDATAAASTNALATNSLAAAQNAVAASQQDLFNVISSLTNFPAK